MLILFDIVNQPIKELLLNFSETSVHRTLQMTIG